MDTRQLAAFCAVVERKSFSQAAAALGVTQPAVSLQVRSLEKRLGRQLLDRSGRRVEPTEDGVRLYRGARRLLALEEELLDELSGSQEGAIGGRLDIGASTGPAGGLLTGLLCELQRRNPALTVGLHVYDTDSVIEKVGRRELELGVVGAQSRSRSVTFEPFFRDEVVLACPMGHRFAGRTISLDELSGEQLILMQDGAGVRRIIEDELRNAGRRVKDLDVHLELGLQESVKAAVLAGYGVTFISRDSIGADLAAGLLSEARVEGLEPARDVMLVRAAGRPLSRAAEAFLEFARKRLPGAVAGPGGGADGAAEAGPA